MPKVMIVDNERTTAMLLQTLLELDGFEAVVAPNGKDALQKAVQATPDIFLVDYRLDDMNGVDLIRELRALDPFTKTPIVMASGMNVEDEARSAGASLFLIKPIDPSILGRTLRSLIT